MRKHKISNEVQVLIENIRLFLNKTKNQFLESLDIC